jgi:hypothetical protein
MTYDTQTDEWITDKTPPMMYIAGGCMTTGVFAPVKIYATSKGVAHSTFLSNWVYDPVEDTWSNTQNMPTFRDHFGVAIIDDLLYVIGGRTVHAYSDEILSKNEQYVPIGYHGKNIASNSNSPADNLVLVCALIVTVVAVTVAAAVLFFFKNKGKKQNTSDSFSKNTVLCKRCFTITA